MPRAGCRHRLAALLCVILVLASGFWSAGWPGGTFAVPELPVIGDAEDRLAADEPAELAAILAWRHVAGIEAKRIVPDGPPGQPAALQPFFAPDLVATGPGLHTGRVPIARSRLLLYSRTPTGPPIA